MEYVGIVIILSLLQYFYFGFQVGQQRIKNQEAAIEVPQNLQLKRANRVHLNTGEWLILFIPMLVMCAYFWDPRFAAGFGVLWLIGRFMYRAGYMKDGKSRFKGFMLGNISVLLLMIGAIYGIGYRFGQNLPG